MKSDRKTLGLIKQPFGATMAFTGGLEHETPTVEVVSSEHHNASPQDLNLKISQRHRYQEPEEIMLSVETLKRILAWAKGQD